MFSIKRCKALSQLFDGVGKSSDEAGSRSQDTLRALGQFFKLRKAVLFEVVSKCKRSEEST